MSEVTNGPGGSPDSDASGIGGNDDATNELNAGGDNSKKDTVAYETYRKTQRQEKAARLENEKLRTEAEQLRQEKLEAEGKTQELYESAKKRADESEARRKSDAGRFIKATLHGQLETAAAEHGCIDKEALLKFTDLESLIDEVDTETLRAPKEKISAEIDRIKKAKSYLFQNTTPDIDTNVPRGDAKISGDYATELSKCRTQGQLDAVRQKFGRY